MFAGQQRRRRGGNEFRNSGRKVSSRTGKCSCCKKCRVFHTLGMILPAAPCHPAGIHPAPGKREHGSARLGSLSMSTGQDLPSPNTAQERSRVHGAAGAAPVSRESSARAPGSSSGIAPAIQTHHKPLPQPAPLSRELREEQMDECRLIKQLITAGSTGSAWRGCKPPRAAPHSSHPDGQQGGSEIKMTLQSSVRSSRNSCSQRRRWSLPCSAFPSLPLPGRQRGCAPGAGIVKFPNMNASLGSACP